MAEREKKLEWKVAAVAVVIGNDENNWIQFKYSFVSSSSLLKFNHILAIVAKWTREGFPSFVASTKNLAKNSCRTVERLWGTKTKEAMKALNVCALTHLVIPRRCFPILKLQQHIYYHDKSKFTAFFFSCLQRHFDSLYLYLTAVPLTSLHKRDLAPDCAYSEIQCPSFYRWCEILWFFQCCHHLPIHRLEY